MNKKKKISTKEEIIERLIEHHTNWCKRDKENSQFNYSYIRQVDSVLSSAIDRKIFGIKGLANAFKLAGINPLCHLKGTLYGKDNKIKDKKKNFLNVLYYLLLEVGSPEKLNDLNINNNQTFVLSRSFQDNKVYPVCEKQNCQLLPITFRSVYAEGRRLYGDWGSALKAAGFNYEDIRRKRPKFTREEVMEDLMEFFEENDQQLSVNALRKNNLVLYKGIFNSHNQSPFFFANRPVIETAIIELQYNLKKESEPDLTPEVFYKNRKK